MKKNLISLTLSDAQLDAADQALSALEFAFTDLIALTPEQRKTMAHMGDTYEAFSRQTISVLAQNPQVLPSSFDFVGTQSDLTALDRLRPRLQRLQRLAERATDSEMALGSDVYRSSLVGYRLLKVAGNNQGLEELKKQLGARFAKSPRGPKTGETEAG